MSDIDVEGKAVALFTDSAKFAKMYSLGLREEYFDSLTNKAAYEFAEGYWRDSGYTQTPTKEALESKVDGLKVRKPDESPVFLVHELKKKYITRMAQKAILDTANSLDEDPIRSVHELNDELWHIQKKMNERRNQSNLVDDLVDRRKKYREKVEQAKSGELGESLGFDEIDEVSSGVRPGELVTIVGASKVGKTWLALLIAKREIENHRRVLFLSLEMDVEAMVMRFESLLSGVSYNHYDKAQLTLEEVNKLKAAQDREKDLGYIHFVKPKSGERTVEDIIAMAKDEQCNILIIDQLSFIEDSSSTNKSEQVSKIILDLKAGISDDEDFMIPTVLIAQFNRNGAKAVADADISDIALSSEVERTSDAIISLSQTQEEKKNDSLYVNILASRRYDIQKFQMKRKLDDCTLFECIGVGDNAIGS